MFTRASSRIIRCVTLTKYVVKYVLIKINMKKSLKRVTSESHHPSSSPSGYTIVVTITVSLFKTRHYHDDHLKGQLHHIEPRAASSSSVKPVAVISYTGNSRPCPSISIQRHQYFWPPVQKSGVNGDNL